MGKERQENLQIISFGFYKINTTFALAIQKVLTKIAGWSSGSSLGS